MTFTIQGNPVGKPRQTQRDKWQQRPCVMRYRAWADLARLAAPADLPPEPLSVYVWAYLPIPASASKREQQARKGNAHRMKPDADNILKAVIDSLFPHDEVIALQHVEKFWDDGMGPRVVVEVR